MVTINPYLNFMGKTEEVFNFYKSVFGGEFLTFQRFKDMPEGSRLPKNEQDRIMHVSLPLGKGPVLMGSDGLESMGHSIRTGNNFYIMINAESKEEADSLYNKLSAGGKIEMALGDTFWGAYYGSFADKYGVQWMINYAYEQPK
ncbi:MAG: VOC family protein [Spirochaetales bacterium]|nr:MAG: VOC family protein [Spirochaetales bacterium]